jgi:hypothetical protein
MPKPWTAVLIVALSVAGIACSQINGLMVSDVRQQSEVAERIGDERNGGLPRTCAGVDGITYNLDDVASVGEMHFQCVNTYGERLAPRGARWIRLHRPQFRLQPLDGSEGRERRLITFSTVPKHD